MLSCSFVEVFIRQRVWTFPPLSVDFFSLFLSLPITCSVSMITILSLAAFWIVLSHYSADTAISLTTLPLSWQLTPTLLSKLASWSEWENQCIKIHLFSTATSVYKNVYSVFSLIPFGLEKQFLISFFKQTAVKQKQQNSSCPVCLWASLKVHGWTTNVIGGITVVLAITVSQLQ